MKKLIFILLIMVITISLFFILKNSTSTNFLQKKETINEDIEMSDQVQKYVDEFGEEIETVANAINKYDYNEYVTLIEKIWSYQDPGAIARDGYSLRTIISSPPDFSYIPIEYYCAEPTEVEGYGNAYLVMNYGMSYDKASKKIIDYGASYYMLKDTSGSGLLFPKVDVNFENPFERTNAREMAISIGQNDIMSEKEYNSEDHLIPYETWVNCAKQYNLPKGYELNFK
ncbi:MAG: hypothetical protein ACK5HS_03765 [Mycoplasmatales bacterium]